jgi:voltage-gated potassium channel
MRRLRSIKKTVYNIIEQDDDSFWSKAFDLFITALILLNVTALILETVPNFQEQYGLHLENFEFYSVIIFTVEYLLRFWSCTENNKYRRPIKGRLKYMISFSAIIDLIAFVPYYFIGGSSYDARILRVIRIFRIVRIFKLSRYSKSANLVGNVLNSRRVELGISIGIILMLLLIASSFIYFAENEAQPVAFESIPAAMWWGITTLTTVGYGDVVPITVAGKVIGGFISILGVGLFALPAGIITNGFNEHIKTDKRFNRKIPNAPKDKCPHCGKGL